MAGTGNYVGAAMVIWVGLVGYWVYQQQKDALSGNAIAQCCTDGVLVRYPEGFEICPQCRDLFETLCPHRSVSTATFDKAMDQLQRLLKLKRDLIMLVRRADTTAQKQECIGVAENARELCLRSLKEFLSQIVDAQIAPFDNANKIMKFAHDVVTRHSEDVKSYCSDEQK